MKIRILTAFLLCLAAPALAQTPAPRTISMNGQGEVKGAPDTVSLSAGVSAQARTAAAALAANSRSMEAVLASLKKQGIDVSSPQVSMVLKRMGFRPRKRRKNGSTNETVGVALARKPAAGRTDRISIEDLLAAKKVVAQLGGTDRALATIAALKRFES